MHGVAEGMALQPSSTGGQLRKRRRRNKPLPRGPFDRRTRLAKRSGALAKMFTAQLIGEVTPALSVKVAAAAELVALSESYRASFLRGMASVPLDDLVRLERLAGQAVRALGLHQRARPAGPDLAQYLASATNGEDV